MAGTPHVPIQRNREAQRDSNQEPELKSNLPVLLSSVDRLGVYSAVRHWGGRVRLSEAR